MSDSQNPRSAALLPPGRLPAPLGGPRLGVKLGAHLAQRFEPTFDGMNHAVMVGAAVARADVADRLTVASRARVVHDLIGVAQPDDGGSVLHRSWLLDHSVVLEHPGLLSDALPYTHYRNPGSENPMSEVVSEVNPQVRGPVKADLTSAPQPIPSRNWPDSGSPRRSSHRLTSAYKDSQPSREVADG